MSFLPIAATVVENRVLSPSFRRITLRAPGCGPAVPVRDLRVKLLVTEDPIVGDGDWYASLSAQQKADLRTYSIRYRRGSGADVEVDIDFVEHVGGLASDWARNAQVGDGVTLIAPDEDDDSGVGIEFCPGDAEHVCLFGDETAAPAIARILEDLPSHVRAEAWVEVATAADALEVAVPAKSSLRWLAREGRPRGSLLGQAFAASLGLEQDEAVVAYQAGADGAGADDAVVTDGDLVWETPLYSAVGEEVDGALPVDRYWWIAGESRMVTGMRRLAVNEAGIPRHQVSFMGYWRQT